jgi:hypothetical protein
VQRDGGCGASAIVERKCELCRFFLFLVLGGKYWPLQMLDMFTEEERDSQYDYFSGAL